MDKFTLLGLLYRLRQTAGGTLAYAKEERNKNSYTAEQIAQLEQDYLALDLAGQICANAPIEVVKECAK